MHFQELAVICAGAVDAVVADSAGVSLSRGRAASASARPAALIAKLPLLARPTGKCPLARRRQWAANNAPALVAKNPRKQRPLSSR